MIAKRFEFTRDLLMESNSGVYFRLRKIACEFKDRARACRSGGKYGLGRPQ